MLEYTYHDGYRRVYVPNIESIKLTDLEHYKYIKSVDVGRQKGHIIEGNNEYIMCLSKDDTVKVHLDIYMPLGFTRKTIQELEVLAAKFYKAYKAQFSRTYNGENRVTRKNLKKVVEPAKFDNSKSWPDKGYGHYVINVKTKKEVSLHQPKMKIGYEIGMSTVLLDTMLSCGYLIYDWCYKGKLLDGRTWDEYFAGAKPKKKIYETIEVTKFVKENEEIVYTNMRTTACKLKTNDRVLSKAIKTQSEINGYKIVKEQMTVERAGL